jgi:predicted transcriptional regulator
MKTPCETIVWSIVPVIKKEFAKNLVIDSDLTQREVASKLETTEAAISRYISGKRGILKLTDKEILNEIKKSSIKISKENGKTAANEICRICKLIRSKNLFEIDNINSC